MTITPFVGEPAGISGVCVYSRIPGDLPCGELPTVHLCVESAVKGVVGLAACGNHEGIARASGRVLDEHSYEPPFCKGGACWPSDTGGTETTGAP
jgi:hypothetical protein